MRFILLSLLFVNAAQAATYYVRDGGDGSTPTTSWAGAYDQITSAEAAASRGDTIYVADGTYNGVTFNVAASGTSRITVKKATTSDHGTETGWLSTYGDGVASCGTLSVTTAYYTIDGQTGGGPGSWDTGHGFVFNGESSIGTACCTLVADATGIILAHLDLDAGYSTPADARTLTIFDADNLTIQYCAIQNSGSDLISGNNMNDLLIEYSYLARNHSDAMWHGDILEYQIGDASNFTIRYCWGEDLVGSYGFGSHDPIVTGYYIYGNIFYWTIEPFFGNGFVGTLGAGGTLNTVYLVNNTFAGEFTGSSGVMGLSSMGGGTGSTAWNNLWYQPDGTAVNIGLGSTHASNTAYNASGSDAEEDLTGNPFTSYPTDFSLSSDATAGTDASSIVSVDMFGNAYNADGDWDRGAIAFDAAPPPTPNVPRLGGLGLRGF